MNISTTTIRRAAGFSLTEMLIATGIMAIGLVMVATIFPVGVKLTTLTTERTIGSIVADEAFAKVQLYGLRDFIDWPGALRNPDGLTDPAEATYYAHSDYLYTTNGVLDSVDGVWGTEDDEFIWPGVNGVFENGGGDDVTDSIGLFLSESQYPSGDLPAGEKHRYYWSALCRRVGLKDVQMTVFVTRKALGSIDYYNNPFDYTVTGDYLMQDQAEWPTPIKVDVVYDPAFPRQLEIQAGLGSNSDLESLTSAGNELLFLSKLFDEGYALVGDHNGAICRILEMEDVDGDNIKEVIDLYEDWKWTGYPMVPAGPIAETVWVVPPGVGSNRYPCIGVYQKIIRFDELN